MRMFTVLVLAFGGMLLLAACGGGDGGTTQPAAAQPTASPAPAAATQPETDVKLVEVEATFYKFTPANIVLKLGEPVQFKAINPGGGIHTFTVVDLGIDVDISKRPKQTEVSEVFIPDRTGRFRITCRVHDIGRYPGMQGILEITESGEPST